MREVSWKETKRELGAKATKDGRPLKWGREEQEGSNCSVILAFPVVVPPFGILSLGGELGRSC